MIVYIFDFFCSRPIHLLQSGIFYYAVPQRFTLAKYVTVNYATTLGNRIFKHSLCGR